MVVFPDIWSLWLLIEPGIARMVGDGLGGLLLVGLSRAVPARGGTLIERCPTSLRPNVRMIDGGIASVFDPRERGTGN